MHKPVQDYIALISNQNQRAYASQYWVTACMGSEAPHYRAYNISHTQAQAVRVNIDALLPKTSRKPQKPCDVGLFGDEASQLDLIELLQEPLDI